MRSFIGASKAGTATLLDYYTVDLYMRSKSMIFYIFCQCNNKAGDGR